ncbi:hypothetical protein JCM11641_007260 [Rhodosporidiobolus odoratus]
MAEIQDDFAAYTTIGERVAPPTDIKKPLASTLTGPSFALNPKLEPFVLLAKSARGSGAAALVSQAVSAQGVYVFSELLQQSSIKDLEKSEQHQAQYRLLELFAYGTWQDYVAKRDDYPTLTSEQETKLKQLTILSLATKSRSIPYSTLLHTLSLPDIPTLEDLLISAFYSAVLTGRLDQKAELLEVLSATGRDVRPLPTPTTPALTAPVAIGGGETENENESMQLDAPPTSSASTATAALSVSDLTASLTSFAARLSTLLSSLDQHITTLRAAQLNTLSIQSAHETAVNKTIEEVQKSDKDKVGGGAGAGAGAGAGGKGGWKDKIGDMAGKAVNALGAGGLTGVGGSGGSGAGGGGEGMDLDLPSPSSLAGGSGAGSGSASGTGGGGGVRGGQGEGGGGRNVPRKRGRNI